jgi:hypothetical protein
MQRMRAEHVCQVCKMPMNIFSLCLRIRGRPLSEAVIACSSPHRSGLQTTILYLGFVL